LVLTQHKDAFLKERFIENGSQALTFYQQKIVKALLQEHREALAKLIASL